MANRTPVIGVMGGSKANEEQYAMARRLGWLIAKRGWVLLNGGRNSGVMAASAEGAKEAGGVIIGVLPDRSDTKASPHLDYVILTGMGHARNVINVLSSDVVIACPGAMGTRSEIDLALANKKPVIAIGHELEAAYDLFRKRGTLQEAKDPEEAIELAAALLSDD